MAAGDVSWQDAIFAPGWVWSALSLILVVGSLLGVYRQVRLQAGHAAREQLESIDREWNTERLDRCKLEVLRAYRDAPGHLVPLNAASQVILTYWERVGALAKIGHVDLKLLHSFNGGACPVWWLALGPTVRRLRTDRSDPTEYNEFEWLADRMDDFDRRRGAGTFDAGQLESQLPERIAVYEDRLRLEQELRAPDVRHQSHQKGH